MGRAVLLILLILFIAHCKGPETKLDDSYYRFDIVKTSGTKVPVDSVKKAESFIAGQPPRIFISDPDTVPYSSNKKEALPMSKLNVLPPDIRIPGEEPYSFPDTVPAGRTIVPITMPSPVEVKDAFTKSINPYSFSYYAKLQGLTHEDITCIMEDNKGNIWIGTWGGGITRYDGKYFTHFNESHGLSSNAVRDIMQDSKGNIWIATWGGGITLYDGYGFTYFTMKEGLKTDFFMTFIEDQDGNIWLSSWDNGVTKFDGKNFIHYNINMGLGGNQVMTSFIDEDGLLWFGLNGGGITAFDGHAFYNYSIAQNLPSSVFYSAFKDSQGLSWFGTNGSGVIIHDGKDFYQIAEEHGLGSNYVFKILEDNDGLIWFALWDGGISKFDGKYFYSYTEEVGLVNNNVTTLTKDSKGNMWFGHWGGGVSRFFGNVFKHYTTNEGLVNNNIGPIFQDNDGKLWIGTNGGGINRFDGENFYHYTTEQGIPDDLVWNGIVDKNGDIWVSNGSKGVHRFDGKYFYQYSRQLGLLNNYVFYIYEDSKDNLWFGTNGGGVTKFDGKYFTNFTTENGLANNFVYSILEDSHGNMWFGTWGGGLCMYDGEQFTHFTQDNGLNNNYIFSIIEDNNQNIWVTSNGGGVSMYNGEYFLNLTEKDGLISDFVLSVLLDNQGNIWFGTRYGLSKLSEKNLNVLDTVIDNKGLEYELFGFLFENHTYSDGFFGMGSNRASIYQDDEGTIWIGANDRLTAFYPQNITPDTIPPNINISRIGLFNENIDWGSLYNKDTIIRLGNGVKVMNYSFDGLSKWYSLPKNLSLAHFNNNITFEFVGITTNFSDKVSYSFKLEGIDKMWNKPTKNNRAHYGNLPHGKYVFKVKAFNSKGFASEELLYEFVVKPPWWKTWWAYLSYFSIGFALLGVFVKYREQSLKLKNKFLDREIELVSKSLEFKRNFLANMSHEIRTPLTGILGMTELILRSKSELHPEVKDYVLSLKQSGENLKEIINQILDYSKIEAGKVSLKNENFSIKSLVKHIENLFVSINTSEEIVFEVDVDPEIPECLYGDRQRIEQVIGNLVSNAIKFTEKGIILFKVSLIEDEQIKRKKKKEKKNDFIKIKVNIVDTGIGISSKEQKHLFVPFAQIEQKDTRELDSTGLGLAICKEIVKLLEGEIGVNSEKNKGSDFWFTFKVRKASESIVIESEEYEMAIKGKKCNILFVEDKVVTQKVVRLLLESMGHKVVIAQNGKEAIDIYKPGKFDLIFMDIQMPVMDGITATNVLKLKHPDMPPIVGLSANAFEGDREKYMDLGLDEYINKPISDVDIKRILKKMILDKKE